MPIMTNPFQLKTIRANMTAKSLTVVWEQSELDNCFSLKDLQFSVCDYFLQRGSCYQNKTGENDRDVETIGDKYYRIQFHNLKPCQSHQLLIEHVQAHQVKREIEPTMQTFEYDRPEYEDDDNFDSSSIMIDNNGDSDIHAWGTIWYEFKTKKTTSPMLFNVLKGSQKESSLTLQWTKDPCLPNPKGWVITKKTDNDSIVGTNFIETNKTDTDEDYGNGIVENTVNKLENSDLSEVDKFYEEWKSEGSGDYEGSGAGLYDSDDEDNIEYEDSNNYTQILNVVLMTLNLNLLKTSLKNIQLTN
jgi:hypothetical protein